MWSGKRSLVNGSCACPNSKTTPSLLFLEFVGYIVTERVDENLVSRVSVNGSKPLGQSSDGGPYHLCCEPVIVNLDGYVKTKKSLQWLYADAATCGTPAWIGKGLTCVCFKRKGAYERICINLTPLQEERLKRLKHRMKVYFDGSRPDHQEALRALWSATYPGQELQGLISDQWKEMGWQGRDPSTDFRGAGFISLENLLFFAKTFSTSFQRLLKKQGGKRAAWEYPFAVAGVNITFMIMQMLDLDASKPRTFIRSVFLQMLSENEWAFDLLYCVAFMVMDKQWLERNATYMEFNDVLKSTRAQLERELLMDDVLRIEDMPSYSLLC
ncbi:ELMO/CED-12 domain-containing protein isoform 1 [Theobroma cacao]|uniref:ELMO/CED-12 domain-containing protein isoform 1 n=1 Tax=Theobroma cacao TaxID=3641 RepID=A0A061EC60_THECC|nr:ELMO/CED-12 domain-containing protein isoform 1 [Theobroma cacao]